MTTTDVLVWCNISGREVFFFANGITDGTETEVKTQADTKSIGEKYYGQVLKRVRAQATDGSILSRVVLYGDDGQKVYDFPGKERTIGNPLVNADSGDIAVPITKGMQLDLTTTD